MSEPKGRPSVGARIALAIIAMYRRLVSPWLGRNCRYHPTCSAYASEALTVHGLMRGGGMALRRIGRCHPFREGGFDPVPQRNDNDPVHHSGIAL